MRQQYDEFVKRDAEIIVVGPDRASVFKLYWAREKLPFVGLSDPKHTVAERYGQEVKLLKLGRMPALMIVDKKGRVRFTHYAQNMRDYPEMEGLYAVLDKLQGEKQDKDAAA